MDYSNRLIYFFLVVFCIAPVDFYPVTVSLNFPEHWKNIKSEIDLKDNCSIGSVQFEEIFEEANTDTLCIAAVITKVDEKRLVYYFDALQLYKYYESLMPKQVYDGMTFTVQDNTEYYFDNPYEVLKSQYHNIVEDKFNIYFFKETNQVFRPVASEDENNEWKLENYVLCDDLDITELNSPVFINPLNRAPIEGIEFFEISKKDSDYYSQHIGSMSEMKIIDYPHLYVKLLNNIPIQERVEALHHQKTKYKNKAIVTFFIQEAEKVFLSEAFHKITEEEQKPTMSFVCCFYLDILKNYLDDGKSLEEKIAYISYIIQSFEAGVPFQKKFKGDFVCFLTNYFSLVRDNKNKVKEAEQLRDCFKSLFFYLALKNPSDIDDIADTLFMDYQANTAKLFFNDFMQVVSKKSEVYDKVLFYYGIALRQTNYYKEAAECFKELYDSSQKNDFLLCEDSIKEFSNLIKNSGLSLSIPIDKSMYLKTAFNYLALQLELKNIKRLTEKESYNPLEMLNGVFSLASNVFEKVTLYYLRACFLKMNNAEKKDIERACKRCVGYYKDWYNSIVSESSASEKKFLSSEDLYNASSHYTILSFRLLTEITGLFIQESLAKTNFSDSFLSIFMQDLDNEGFLQQYQYLVNPVTLIESIINKGIYCDAYGEIKLWGKKIAFLVSQKDREKNGIVLAEVIKCKEVFANYISTCSNEHQKQKLMRKIEKLNKLKDCYKKKYQGVLYINTNNKRLNDNKENNNSPFKKPKSE